MSKFSPSQPENPNWISAHEEIYRAFKNRQANMEGRARVCARRAAGLAFLAAGLCESPTLAGIRQAISNYDLPDDILQICSNLMQPVNKHYNLDTGSDLLLDVNRLIDRLENQDLLIQSRIDGND
ncbi:MAG: hypothetical protein GX577_00665 [Leptolinea sp.]|nr:hypothetical protein [Leptolinea sp.]